MSHAEPTLDEFDPATLDVISPEKYERGGYPHADWTWLRQNDPVRWFENDWCDPFWAVTKHADIVAIGKDPKDWLIEPRIAVFTNDGPEEPTTRHLVTGTQPPMGLGGTEIETISGSPSTRNEGLVALLSPTAVASRVWSPA